MKESWHPVVGFEGLYEVSDLGNVRSLDRVVEICGPRGSYGQVKQGVVLRQRVNRYGYACVHLYKDKTSKNRPVHALVAEAFLGPRPANNDVCHGTGGKTNNALSNLSYGSKKKNYGEDKLRDGKHCRGARNGSHSGISEETVLAIYRDPDSGRGAMARIARKYKVTIQIVSHIRRGDRWGWLTASIDPDAGTASRPAA